MDRGKARAVAMSVGLHVVLVGLMISGSLGLTTSPPPIHSYQVDIVSPPPAEEGPTNMVEKTDKLAPPAIEKKDKDKTPTTKPVPVAAPPAKSTHSIPKASPDQTPTGKNADPTATSAGAGIDLHIPGVVCPTQEYCDNILIQVKRTFQPPAQSPRMSTEVAFYIERDGSVSNVQIFRRSGDFGFDARAEGTIEEIGRIKGFGPLPKAFGQERLFVQFEFKPNGQK